MAVETCLYGKTDVQYEGCVLSTYERNGYHDSDFYAVCWDEEKQAVVDVEYDTTRAGGGGYANIDATPETIRKAYRFYKKIGTDYFDNVSNPNEAKKIRIGDEVVVVKGRKVPKGLIGDIFWVGTRFNHYSYRDERRVGIEVDGERMFLPEEYVEVVGWEHRLITGKHRKEKIRNFAINSLPVWCRGVLIGGWSEM